MPHEPAATRRTALRAVALTAAMPALLAACGGAPATDLTPDAADQEGVSDPDLVVVAGVLGELAALVALLERTRAEHPPLRSALAPTLRVHRAQLDAVLATGADDPGPASGPRVAGTPAAAFRALREREETAHRRLTSYAVDARSGALARLVAAVAAGVAQQQVLLASTGVAATAGSSG